MSVPNAGFSLRIAKKFNFVIFEDDAYYFLDFQDTTKRARSYLSLESEVNGDTGRVVRFDSLSKIVSSGELSAVRFQLYRQGTNVGTY
jgi:DNA-binding transcriptional MocR family regulator